MSQINRIFIFSSPFAFLGLIGLCLISLFRSSWAHASELAPLSQVALEQAEIRLTGEAIQLQNWDSAQLKNKVYLIQHIAGRSKAKEMNAPMIEAIKTAGFAREQYQTVTIVNLDDAIWGTTGIVRSKVETNKKNYPWSMFVLDTKGKTNQAWGIPSKTSTIIVLAPSGQPLFRHSGALTEPQIQQILQLIRKNLE